MHVLAEVVSYDPVRRKGFLRTLDPKIGSIFFGYSLLPEEMKSALREAMGRVRDALRYVVPEGERDDFKAASHAAVLVIKRQQFAMEVLQRSDGKWKISPRTMEQFPGPIWNLGERVRIRALLGPPEAYDDWSGNQCPPAVGDVGTLVDYLHAPGIPDHYVVESPDPLGNRRPLWLGDFVAQELESIR